MKKKFLIALFSGLLNFTYSQLDPMYHGTYFKEDLTSSFTLYSLDESSEHCFFVDFEEYLDLDRYNIISGNGHCDDSQGMKAEFYFEEYQGTVYARFEKDEEDAILMYVKFPNSEVEELFIFSGQFDDLYEEEVSLTDEVYLQKEDGSSLVLFDQDGLLGFTLTGNPNCTPNTITGILLPEDDEMTIFNAEIEGCKIQVQSSDQGLQVKESNCSKFHKKCAPWEGFYIYK